MNINIIFSDYMKVSWKSDEFIFHNNIPIPFKLSYTPDQF